MKRTILSCAIVAALAISCAEKQQGESYHIVGSAKSELEGSTIYLSELHNKVKLDSAVVAGGKFELKGTFATPAIFTLHDGGEGVVVTTGDMAEVTIAEQTAVVQNSVTDAIHAIAKELYDVQMDYRKFYSENREDINAVMAKREQVNEIMASIHSKYLAENADNLAGAYSVMRQIIDTETLEQVDSLIALAPLAANLRTVVTNRQNKVQALKTAEGEPFVDFSCTDMEGNPVKLSDYVGKGSYVLVDFWASWCGPCRAEMPNLKAAYESHKEDGLVLLGVNVWDSKEACVKAITEEDMTWPILYASDDKTATESYGIMGIPTIILFSPDGIIVDRMVRGAKIKLLTDSIFEK